MRISDWSSDVCSSDLGGAPAQPRLGDDARRSPPFPRTPAAVRRAADAAGQRERHGGGIVRFDRLPLCPDGIGGARYARARSEEHTSEIQSLMRISYADFCLKKTNNSIIIYSSKK